MESAGIDALLLTHPADLAYLTDFTGDDSVGIVTGSKILLVTDFRYEEQARQEAPKLKTVLREGSMSDALADALLDLKVNRIGFEASRTLAGDVLAIQKRLTNAKRKPSLKLQPVHDLMVNLRKIKDQRELNLIRQAVTVAQDAYTSLRATIRVGQTESELAGRLIYELRRRGAQDASFPPIIAAGANSALPHYRPAGRVPVKANQLLLLDWGALVGGYCSDLTRTLLVGKVNAKLREIYQIVLEAQLAAIATIRPGVGTQQVDQAARGLIDKAGYGKQFGHGTGHGIGRDIHELPNLRKNPSADEPLVAGMVVTVEPGIYLPGLGGVRIEDDVLVTPTGCKVLTSLDKSMESCRIG